MDHLCYLRHVLCFHAFASAHYCLVVTCWERADILVLVCDVKLCFGTCPCGILGQAWYLIVLIPNLCGLFTYNCDFRLNCTTVV